ncbi:hypothetical protein Syn7502_02059 [Synechococcus sp. PCC 7502]|uniref:hypothetical protein n=1 Tax=Synechococcus sp. PCC 7502 TaxID=1173263 RepID=UPI00029F9B42|nr:hypothetical protein [Synechococcus sp. PCC 7502]AFY74081.1 hypothetical protein Syn7502_02059 [Synechococcus sp. PCC 7502]
MQKLSLGYFFTTMSIAIASTALIGVTSAQAETGEFIDSSSPQVIQNISGNIITFKGREVEAHNYYVPYWMFSKYNLQVGSSVYLYNRNVIQGIYRGPYVDAISDGLLKEGAFSISQTRRYCTVTESPASEGLEEGKRIWYKSECCLATIPVVGAMWMYEPQAVVYREPVIRQVTPIPYNAPAPIPAPVNPPVRGLW